MSTSSRDQAWHHAVPSLQTRLCVWHASESVTDLSSRVLLVSSTQVTGVANMQVDEVAAKALNEHVA